MVQKKTHVTALMSFSHGNVVAVAGKTYAMNPGDAKELEKAGFVSAGADGEPEQTQADQPAQAKQVGDVVVDDEDDILGEKMAGAVQNKMADTPVNKAARAGKKAD